MLEIFKFLYMLSFWAVLLLFITKFIWDKFPIEYLLISVAVFIIFTATDMLLEIFYFERGEYCASVADDYSKVNF